MKNVKEKMKLKDVIVPNWYSEPNPDKLAECRMFYMRNGRIDRDIVVDRNGVINDGYVGYLVLVENNVEEIDVVVRQRYEPEYLHNSTTYVFGRHNPRLKEYVWRVTEKTKNVENLQVGNRVMVQTRYGVKAVTITKIETLDTPPTQYRVKKVLKCF